MAKKLVAFIIVAVLVTAAMPGLVVSAFEPDKDSALTKYYGFEDNVGDAKSLSKPDAGTDLSAGGNLLYTEGVHGKAFQFDGTTGLDIGLDVVKGTKFTVAFWMNPEDITPWTAAFFGRRFDEGDPAQFWMSVAPRTDLDANPDRMMMFWTCGQEDYSYWFDGVTTVKPELNKWIHIAVTVNEEDIVVYGDGKIIFDTRTTDANYTDNIYNLSDAWALGGAQFYLGVNEFADAAFKGKMDEFYAFNRALSESEVVELMNYNPNGATTTTPAAETPAESAASAAEQPAVNEALVVAQSAPQTGDNMIFFGIIAAICLAGTVTFARKSKKI